MWWVALIEQQPTKGQTDGWMDGQTDGRIDGYIEAPSENWSVCFVSFGHLPLCTLCGEAVIRHLFIEESIPLFLLLLGGGVSLCDT